MTSAERAELLEELQSDVGDLKTSDLEDHLRSADDCDKVESTLDHWTTPCGCHPDCPACAENA